MNEISPDQIEFHRLSFADSNGRLFWWNGQLYRGVSPERKEFYRKLVESGVVQTLIKDGLLIETEVSPFSMTDFPLILKHPVVPFVSYAFEWPSLMLKDAALTLIEIAIELAGEGLMLHDANPWNVLFNASKPIYVDFGSIVPVQSDTLWPAADEFYRFFVYPLRLMSHGHDRIARWLLHDYERGVFKAECEALVHRSFVHLTEDFRSMARACVPPAVRPGIKKLLMPLRSVRLRRPAQTSMSRVEHLKNIRSEVENITIEFRQTEWSNYYDNGYFPSLTPSSAWTAKHQTAHNILAELKPLSVLDIGSNRGWYSQLAASLGINIVAFDNDETAVNRLYRDVKEQNAPILPLVMDFCDPSPGNRILSPAIERLKCDMVLALALVHHMVFKHFLRFENIVASLASFTERTLVVEFIPKEDRFVSEWWSPQYGWYTIENFVGELRRYFNTVSFHPSDPKPRVLVVCQK